jgi:hypothetical protein
LQISRVTAARSLDEGLVTMPDGPDGIVPAQSVTLASGQPVMVCRTTVLRGTISTSVTLFLPDPGERVPSGQDLEAVVEKDPGVGVPAVLQASGTGEATVVTRLADVPTIEAVAMAAAVCVASWGWDESPSIRVSVNDASLLVEPRYTGVGEQWHAAIVATGGARVEPRDAAV